jgi:hypothetical protein
MLEMEYPGIVAESRTRFEQIILEANQPLETIVTEMFVVPGVSEVLANGGELLKGYMYPNPFAHPVLVQIFSTPPVEETTS